MRLITLLLCFSLTAFAGDRTPDFLKNYETGRLSAEETAVLKNTEVIFIPGHMSETFVASDHRSRIDFSVITKDYFGNHLRSLKDLGIPARRLLASSASVSTTIDEIAGVFATTQRPLLFFTHSLGGMALLDYLISHPEKWDRVSGIIFLQSPFSGAPVASVSKKFPALATLFPFVHTSKEVVEYLSNENRENFILKNEAILLELTSRVRIITVAGVANNYRSLFSTSITLIRSGCLKTFRGKCVGPVLYPGPYDNSDGMVPFRSSLLPETDFVVLKGADHGETVLQIPFRGYDHKKLTAALLKFML